MLSKIWVKGALKIFIKNYHEIAKFKKFRAEQNFYLTIKNKKSVIIQNTK